MDNLIVVEGDYRFGSGYGIVTDFVLSTCIWTLIQFILFLWPNVDKDKMSRNDYLEFKVTSLGLIHGNESFLLSAYHWTKHQAECGKEPDGFEYMILVISSGYFIVDVLVRKWFGILTTFVTLHHSTCVLCALFTLSDE